MNSKMPAKFARCDVVAQRRCPACDSQRLVAVGLKHRPVGIEDCSEGLLVQIRPKAEPAGRATGMMPPLVFYSKPSASLSLYLDGLPEALARQIMILPPGRMVTDFPLLASAGLVIFVREFEVAWRSGLVPALKRVGVPCAWFTDDDLTALRDEQAAFKFYTPSHVHEFAVHMTALIGSTPSICKQLSSFHANVLHWPCILNERMLAPTNADPPSGTSIAPATVTSSGHALRVGFVGGNFRVEGLRRLIVPALDAIPGSQLLVADGLAANISQAQVLPFELDFNRFISNWRSARPDILVHPPGQTKNIINKGPGVLLAALYLGAAPIVANEPAFQELGAYQGVLRADRAEDWRAALTTLASPQTRQHYLARLTHHARIAWTAKPAQIAIEALLCNAAPNGYHAVARQRRAAALGWHPAGFFTWRRRLGRLRPGAL